VRNANYQGDFKRRPQVMNDPFDLARFVTAQGGAYAGVVAELKRGRKSGHWIWYIFPQIAGLGSSHMSQKFAISSIDEARAYVQHPVLGPRLVECIELVLAIEGKSAAQILGDIDALKFHSCLTLFAAVANDTGSCQKALEKYFDGLTDPLTTQALRG